MASTETSSERLALLMLRIMIVLAWVVAISMYVGAVFHI